MEKPCVFCGGNAVRRPYEHFENVGGVRVTNPSVLTFVCEKCGEPEISGGLLATLQRCAAILALLDLPHVNGKTLRYARKAAGLRQADLATLLDSTAETMSRYENGHESVPRTVQIAMAGILQSLDRGESTVESLLEGARGQNAKPLIVRPPRAA